MRERNALKQHLISCLVLFLLFAVIFVVNLNLSHRFVATTEEMSKLSNVGQSISLKLNSEEIAALANTQQQDSDFAFRLDVPNKLWGNILFVEHDENLAMYFNYQKAERIFITFLISLGFALVVMIPIDTILKKKFS